MKVDIELHVVGDGRTFLNFWNHMNGDDVVAEIIDGNIIYLKYDKEELIQTEISLQEFMDLVKTKVKSWEPDYRESLSSEDCKRILAARIDNMRKIFNLSQLELASKINMKPSQLNKCLSGNRNFTIETLFKFEKALNIKLLNY